MRLFITATNTGVGKTHVSAQLAKLAQSQGLQPGYFKPIETGVASSPNDGSKLHALCQELNPNLNDIPFDMVVPYQFSLPAAPFVAKDKEIDSDFLAQRAEELERLCDILIIEGAGGLMVPIECDFFMVDLIQKLRSPALLVTPSELGCINHTLLSLEALRRRNIPHLWYVNLYKDKESFFEVTAPFYERCLGEVPLDLASVFDRYRHGDLA